MTVAVRADLASRPPRRTRLLQGLLLAGVALLAILCPVRAPAASLSAAEIVDRIDNLYRGATSHGRIAMRISTRHWYRSLSLEFWSKGQNLMLIKVREPQKERGIALLRRGSQVWNYLPKVKRLVRLPLSMLSTSCLGSHFTYEDLVKARSISTDYNCNISFRGPRAGQEVVEVTCLPKPGAPVVWGKITVLVHGADYLPQTVRYYDEDLRLVRVMTFGAVKNLGGRRLPSRLEMVPQDKPGERTVLVYEQITFDQPLSDQLFSPAALKQE